MHEVTQKIFSEDVTREAFSAVMKDMKDKGWLHTSTSFHNIVLTFERDIPDSPSPKATAGQSPPADGNYVHTEEGWDQE